MADLEVGPNSLFVLFILAHAKTFQKTVCCFSSRIKQLSILWSVTRALGHAIPAQGQTQAASSGAPRAQHCARNDSASQFSVHVLYLFLKLLLNCDSSFYAGLFLQKIMYSRCPRRCCDVVYDGHTFSPTRKNQVDLLRLRLICSRITRLATSLFELENRNASLILRPTRDPQDLKCRIQSSKYGIHLFLDN